MHDRQIKVFLTRNRSYWPSILSPFFPQKNGTLPSLGYSSSFLAMAWSKATDFPKPKRKAALLCRFLSASVEGERSQRPFTYHLLERDLDWGPFLSQNSVGSPNFSPASHVTLDFRFSLSDSTHIISTNCVLSNYTSCSYCVAVLKKYTGSPTFVCSRQIHQPFILTVKFNKKDEVSFISPYCTRSFAARIFGEFFH